MDPVQAKIDELMSGMTLEKKVGQMFIARCPDVDEEGGTVSRLASNPEMGLVEFETKVII